MKKLMFLFVMMFMTSVSAYSQSQTTYSEIYVDVAANFPGKGGWQIVWKNAPIRIMDFGRGGGTSLTLDLGNFTYNIWTSQSRMSSKACLEAMKKEIDKMMPYLLNGKYEYLMVFAGTLPKSYYNL